MRTVYVCLPAVKDVQAFVEALSGLDGSFDFVDNNYILDARSLMGIFTLDRTKPLRLDIGRDTPETMKAIAPFIEKHAGREDI